MLRIYVASSWRNAFQPSVVTCLRALNHAVYDFRGPGDGWGKHGVGNGPGGFGWKEVDPDWQKWTDNIQKYLDGLNNSRAIEGFNRDMNALKSCDVCVYVMPCGPSASMEMGWACGAGKPVVVYIPALREPDLMVKMANVITDKIDNVVAYLGGLSEGSRKDCYDCKYCFCECGEDIVCGHPQSYAETSFGRGVNYARREGNFCGPNAKLFESRKS